MSAADNKRLNVNIIVYIILNNYKIEKLDSNETAYIKNIITFILHY